MRFVRRVGIGGRGESERGVMAELGWSRAWSAILVRKSCFPGVHAYCF